MMNRKTIILVPYPAQGHVTPILKLAAVLSNHSFRPVVVLPEFIHHRVAPRNADGILCLGIPDGLGDSPRDFFAFERAMEENMPSALESIIRQMINDGEEIACLVADLLASWSIEVARRCHVAVAGFWPAMHASYRLIAAAPQLIQTGVISENGCPKNPNTPITWSSIDPTLSTNDLPWLIGSSSSTAARFRFWTRTLQRAKTLRCMLANTFPNEGQSNTSPRVLEIGPMIMQATSITNGTIWEEDTSCLDWLDDHNPRSVMYVSFGSWVSPINEDKVKTLALTLEALGRPFLWVLGQSWCQGLPKGYTNKVANYGRIVLWAPQVEVLRHPAIGCYLTHCGWNSTMEAILYKKPLLCYPIAGDQFINCRYIVEIWKIGERVEEFGLEEVKLAIERAVGDDVSQRIEGLNEKIYGKEGCSKAMTNLSTFIQDFDV